MLAFLFSQNGSHSVTKYNDSYGARIGKPVTILAVYSCNFPNLSNSELQHPSYTTETYSNIGLTKIFYIFESFLLHQVYLSFFITFNKHDLQCYQCLQTISNLLKTSNLDAYAWKHILIDNLEKLSCFDFPKNSTFFLFGLIWSNQSSDFFSNIWDHSQTHIQ